MRNPAGVLLLLASFIAFAVCYSTSGNRILDPSGNPILLRGVARPSLEWAAAGEGLSLSDYQIMKNWGSNVVRLGLSQCFWSSDPNYKNTVNQQVTWIKSLGMGVILDLHWSVGSGSGCGQQTIFDSASVTFWKDVATKYKNDPWIIFELYNEPHDVSCDVWKNGGGAGGFNTPGFQALYNEVRKIANNVVIINGLNYAFDLSCVRTHPIQGSNIVYGTHPYDFGGKQVGDFANAFGYLVNQYPLIATEFGEFNCNPTYVSAFINYANQNSMSWTGWGWYPQGCGFPSLITNWAGNPSVVGQVVKNSLQNDPKVPNGGTSTTKSATSSSATTKSSTSTTGGTTTGGGAANNADVYTDSLQSGFQDYSWNDKIILVTSPVQSGSNSIRYTPNAWSALYFYRAGFIDTSKHAAIEFYINGGSTGNQQINFNLVQLVGSNSNKIGPDQRVSTYTTSGSIPANSWVKGTVSLSNFPAGTYDGFWFQDQSGTTQSPVYIDSVRIIGK